MQQFLRERFGKTPDFFGKSGLFFGDPSGLPATSFGDPSGTSRRIPEEACVFPEAFLKPTRRMWQVIPKDARRTPEAFPNNS
jgi:hypothetical protein